MIESEPRVAGAVREQYRHFTIDEYQDVSPVQDRLLSLWLGERRDLCVVGDPSQTIYSFAGADPHTCSDSNGVIPTPLSCDWSATIARRRRFSPPRTL